MATKFKKSDFTIGGPKGDSTVNGMISEFFGIDKRKYGYVVTHLPSGRSMQTTAKQGDAKRMVTELEALPIDWKVIDNTNAQFHSLISEIRIITGR